ncbi:MAG: hypothetical protein JRF63_10790 [Deltaproteobacteria bacterium]|nr:hypothetical protein [Deltaproteobacteria bacterium]
MRRHRVARFALLASAITAGACGDVAEPASDGNAGLTARGVTLEVPAGNGTLRAHGDRLELSEGRDEVVLHGDARIELDGPSRIEARADRLRLVADGPMVVMHGRVRATFELSDKEAGDAGL